MIKNLRTKQRNTILVDNSFKIELKDVSFKYPGSTNYLLKNLNLNINFKDKIGITGPSGGGKVHFLIFY